MLCVVCLVVIITPISAEAQKDQSSPDTPATTREKESAPTTEVRSEVRRVALWVLGVSLGIVFCTWLFTGWGVDQDKVEKELKSLAWQYRDSPEIYLALVHARNVVSNQFGSTFCLFLAIVAFVGIAIL